MTNKLTKTIITLSLITLGIYIAISISSININVWYYNLKTDFLKSSKISEKILINGNSGWATAKSTGVCSGFGTYSNPYIIEDLEIDSGGSGSCIWIQNSEVYFKIINCTLYNSGGYWGDGGIKLNNVVNGQIINNTANNNGFIGIILESCSFNIISGNTANTNHEYGIGLWYSHNNIMSKNTFRYNRWGISLETSNNNNLTGNVANDNDNDGIGIWNSIENLVSENNLRDNDDRGIFMYHSDHNNISTNKIISNLRGIYLEESDSNYISINTIRENLIGIEISQSKCNDILNNTFALNKYNIRGTQDQCVPDGSDTPATSTFPIEYVIIPIMIIVPIILILGMSRLKRKPPHKGITFEKSIKKDKHAEIKLKKFKQEIIIPSEIKEISKEQPEDIISPKISKCTFCGFKISDEAIFCPQCGKKIKK